MQSVPSRSFSITMPYHSMKPVPREHRRAYERVRNELQDADTTARRTLQRADRWDRDWTSDLDPSPQRVHRTSEAYGEKRSVEVETFDEAGPYQRPSKLVEEKVGKHKSTAYFEDGRVVRLEQTLHGHHGGVENMTIQVNPAEHTVTYTIHETGEFALQPSGIEPRDTPSGSGPDDVYDEWDNSDRSGGPDEVYDEWDNGRGYYFDGPDGRTQYDPYH